MSGQVKGSKTRFKRAAEQVLMKYGLSLAAFEALWERSDGACEICSKPLRSTLAGDDVRWEKGSSRSDVAYVDHCHESGDVRGLLCSACNTGLGFFRDSPAALVKASEYLSRDGSSVKAVSEGSIGCSEFHAGMDTRAAKRFGDKLKKAERAAWKSGSKGRGGFKYFFEKRW